MARYFRFYGKKRGDRWTGSRKLGSAGFGCFFALFFLAGCVSLPLFFLKYTVQELRVNRDFVEHTCQLLDKRIAENRSAGGVTYAPRFHIRYTIDGRPYTRWTGYDITDVHTGDRSRSQAVLDRFQVGREYPCWRDPRDPGRVVLSRGYTWFAWMMLLVPTTFIAIGGGGLFYGLTGWGISAERRAALARRTSGLDLFDATAGAAQKLPNVPRDADLTNSPGTTLAFRLPTASAGWSLLVLLVVSLVWNGVVAVFVTMAVRGHVQGAPDWFMTIFIIPFALAGIGLVVAFLRQLLITTGVGPTIIEISEHPLYPAGEYEVFVSQAGRLTVNNLCVLLVCDEEAVYRQGTDTRTATRRVYEAEIFRRDGFEIVQGMPFETRLRVQVPGQAMHSFQADHNKVHWRLVVKGDVAGWPNFERGFLVHVWPGAPGE